MGHFFYHTPVSSGELWNKCSLQGTSHTSVEQGFKALKVDVGGPGTTDALACSDKHLATVSVAYWGANVQRKGEIRPNIHMN